MSGDPWDVARIATGIPKQVQSAPVTTRVIALEQAVTVVAAMAHASWKVTTLTVLEMAESFADYIETGRIPA